MEQQAYMDCRRMRCPVITGMERLVAARLLRVPRMFGLMQFALPSKHGGSVIPLLMAAAKQHRAQTLTGKKTKCVQCHIRDSALVAHNRLSRNRFTKSLSITKI